MNIFLFLVDWGCKRWSICEAAREAASLGQVGTIVAKVASLNASGWMKNKYITKGEDVTEAGNMGVAGRNCDVIYKCADSPEHYKFPGAEMVKNDDGIDKIVNHFLDLMVYFIQNNIP